MKRRLLAILLFLVPAVAHAAGGACPTPTQYANGSTTTPVTLASLGVTSCFYASPTGVDTATGTDEAHPWLHLPGMAGCSNVCASTTPAPGNGFILQGGATYHFSGRGTPVGLPWAITWSGTTSNPIYFGVDQTWFTGGSWTRPVITGDNPTSTSSGGVASCTHADDGENWLTVGNPHVIVDFVEGTGACWNTGSGMSIFTSGSTNFVTWTRDYIHGWTRTTGCTASGCAEAGVGFASDNGPDTGPGDPGWGNIYSQVIVDGTDSDNHIFTAMEWQCYNVNNSYFNRYTNIVCAHHIVHDTAFTNTAQSSVTPDHGNTFEENGSVQNAGPNSFYSNFIAHNNNGVNVWLNPQVGSTDYSFDNIVIDITNSANMWNVGDNGGAIGTQIIFNNTFENPENSTVMRCQPSAVTYFVQQVNNHVITDGGSATNCTTPQQTAFTTNLVMTHATATAQGYTAAEPFVYSPTLATNSTVHAGTNEIAGYCAALTSGGNTLAAAACLSDTSYACTYNATSHTVACPARTAAVRPSSWDIGAFQFGNTWYVRADGGTRFSTNVTAGQCDGLADVAYPGSGSNQHCAFNDVRYLWTDGTFNNGVTFPGWGWVVAGGDTMIVRNCIQYSAPFTPIPGSTGKCRTGYNGPQNSTDWFGGIPGDAPDSEMPSIPSGTSSNHTRFLGGNFASCTSNAAKTLLTPGFTVFIGINASGSNWVDVACFEITDNAACSHGPGAGVAACAVSSPFDDFGSRGLQISRTTTNSTFTDLFIHGLATDCISGPTGDGVVLNRIDLRGCPDSTWNADPGDGTTGTGSLLVKNFFIFASGCVEEFPIVHAQPYFICFDDADGGYGDGFGTTTVPSSPGWQLTFDTGTVANSTQDGLDCLHCNGAGSSITYKNVTAYGNMGQQLKAGGSQVTMINNYIYNTCNALRQALTGYPFGFNSGLSDFCRAGDNAIATLIDDSYTSTYQFNTMYSASAIGWGLVCFNSCAHPNVVFQDNTFISFLNNTTNGYPGGGNGFQSQAIFIDVLDPPNPPIPQGDGIWLNSGSLYNHNSSFNNRVSCPATNETNATCTSPSLTSQSWVLSGNVNAVPLSGSNLRGAGIVATPGATVDITGFTRPSPPGISAFEFQGGGPTLTTITVLPNPASTTTSSTVNMQTSSFCTFSDSSTIAAGSAGCVVVWTDTNAHSSINSSTGVVTGSTVGSDTVTATLSPATPGTATVNITTPTVIHTITLGAGKSFGATKQF